VPLYRQKPPQVEAVQYDAPDTAPLTALGADFDTTTDGYTLRLYPTAGSHIDYTPLYPGDWVIKRPGGTFEVCAAGDFTTHYELVP
jgi:hypothetical protein